MQIVEEYLRDNGFLDTVKLLRIYDMSATRGAAHHTCNLAPVSLCAIAFLVFYFSFWTIFLLIVRSKPCVVPKGSLCHLAFEFCVL